MKINLVNQICNVSSEPGNFLPCSGCQLIMSEETVPRLLLDDANRAVEKLRRKLEEATVQGRKEMESALQSMSSQLKTLQSQQKNIEEQLNRSKQREGELEEQLNLSKQREKELEQQLSEADLRTVVISKLRSDNAGLKKTIEELSKKIEANKKTDAEVITFPLLHTDS